MKLSLRFCSSLFVWGYVINTLTWYAAATWEVADEDYDTEDEDCDIMQTLVSGQTVQRSVLNQLLVQIQQNENPVGIYPTFAGTVEAECRIACSNPSADHRIRYTADSDFVGPAYTRFKKRYTAQSNPKTRKICYSVLPRLPPIGNFDDYTIEYDPSQTQTTVVLNVLENDSNTYQSYWEGATKSFGMAEIPVKTSDKRYVEITSYNDNLYSTVL